MRRNKVVAKMRTFLWSSWRTVPWNFGEIFCGLYDTLSCGTPSEAASSRSPDSSAATASSLLSSPAIMRINVVLPVPFSPNMTTISESVKVPSSTWSLKECEADGLSPPPFIVFVIAG